MFLEMLDFDFCPNLIKFNPNFTNFFSKFTRILPNPTWPKFCPNLLKKLLGDAAAFPTSTKSLMMLITLMLGKPYCLNKFSLELCFKNFKPLNGSLGANISKCSMMPEWYQSDYD